MDKQSLEELVSQALYSASRLERAVHDEGPWTISWGPVVVPAERLFHETGVTFTAVFPETCWLERPEPNIVLRCKGEVVGVRAVRDPGDAAFAVSWDLAMTQPEPERVG